MSRARHAAHYLVLSERDVAELGPIAKVNPPIRDEQSREDLWRALQDGRIATISTDHAPWPIEKKQSSMLRASPGAPGLETLLAAIFTEGEKRGVALPELLGYLTWRPAEIFGLGDRKGQLAVGMDADLTVFDARTPHRYDAAQSLCSAKWSPFDGREFAGRVVATYVRGEIVFEDGSLVGEPGQRRVAAARSASRRQLTLTAAAVTQTRPGGRTGTSFAPRSGDRECVAEVG